MGRSRDAMNRKTIEAKPSHGKVDRAVEESFPASDPPAYTTPQPREPGASPQQADASKREGGERKQADWKAGKAVRGTPDPEGVTEQSRHQDKSAET